MKALHIIKYGRFPVLENLPIPEIGDSDLLIRMKYAPINPSDLFFYQGKYSIIKQGYPIVGFQGSGIVEKAKSEELVGKKVAVMANNTNGTHATHIKSSINDVIILPDDSDLQLSSMMVINPLSCFGLCDLVEKQSPQNVLISAAASQIGKMLVGSLRSRHPSLKIFGLNRSLNKSEVLYKLGITQTFLIEDPPSEKSKQLKGKTLFLDCIGGLVAGKYFNVLPPESQLICYGRLSGQDLGGIDLGGLYYRNKSIRGFWLNRWLKQSTPEKVEKAKRDVILNGNKFYKSEVRKIISISDFMTAYRMSIKDRSEGKILLDLS